MVPAVSATVIRWRGPACAPELRRHTSAPPRLSPPSPRPSTRPPLSPPPWHRSASRTALPLGCQCPFLRRTTRAMWNLLTSSGPSTRSVPLAKWRPSNAGWLVPRRRPPPPVRECSVTLGTDSSATIATRTRASNAWTMKSGSRATAVSKRARDVMVIQNYFLEFGFLLCVICFS